MLYTELKVPEQAYGKSLQTYLMDPEKRRIYEEETEKTREKHNTYKPIEMNKAEVMDCAKRLEDFKFAAQQKMYMIVRQQKMPSEMINSIIIFEKENADDQFNFDTGKEEEDVEYNVKRLKMEDDEDYKKMTGDMEAKSKAFLEDRQKESQAVM